MFEIACSSVITGPPPTIFGEVRMKPEGPYLPESAQDLYNVLDDLFDAFSRAYNKNFSVAIKNDNALSVVLPLSAELHKKREVPFYARDGKRVMRGLGLKFSLKNNNCVVGNGDYLIYAHTTPLMNDFDPQVYYWFKLQENFDESLVAPGVQEFEKMLLRFEGFREGDVLFAGLVGNKNMLLKTIIDNS